MPHRPRHGKKLLPESHRIEELAACFVVPLTELPRLPLVARAPFGIAQELPNYFVRIGRVRTAAR
jgi:hypothetical protein